MLLAWKSRPVRLVTGRFGHFLSPGYDMKIESFRFWINDYVTSTVRRRCSLEARGLYVDILMLLYASPRPGYACETINGELRYLDPDEIMSDAGADDCGRLWSELETWGALVRDDDGWHNPKAVDVAENEIDFRRKKAEAGRKGGKAKRKQRSSTASSSAKAQPQANTQAKGKPPDSDPDPDPDSDPTPDTDIPDRSPTEPLSSPKRRRPADVPFAAILDAYNEHLGPKGNPQPTTITDKMRASVSARWTDKVQVGEYRSDSLPFWGQYFEYAAKCPHLTGDNNRGWRASFRWLVDKSGFERVINREYERGGGTDDKNKANALAALELIGN